MTETDPELPEPLRQALRKSPTFTPPESFYRAVLEKIKRPASQEEPRRPVSWIWNVPAKSLAAACVVVIMVLVSREGRRKDERRVESKPAVQEPSIPAPVQQSGNSGGVLKKGQAPAEPAKANAFNSQFSFGLAQSQEVQSRINKPLNDLIGRPSPFEDIDAEARRKLSSLPRSIRARDAAQSNEINAKTYDGPEIAAQAASGAGSLPQSITKEKADQTKFGGGGQAALDWQGPLSGITTFQTVVIENSKDWAALWQRHASFIVPPPAAPEFDFSANRIVGVFAGTKPTAGYAVQIVDITTEADRVLVRYEETRPAPGSLTAKALTNPFALRAIPKTPLPVQFLAVAIGEDPETR